MTTTIELTPIDIQNYSREQAEKLWLNVKDQELAFDDYTRDRGDIFAARLCAIDTMAFEVPEGLAMVTNIVPKLSAEIHFYLWANYPEQQIVDRGRDVVRYMFEEVAIHRLSAFIPVFHRVAQRIATRIGFKYEGAIREQFLTKGKYHDVNVYGLLQQEYRLMRWR
jgi:hypothetical protein